MPSDCITIHIFPVNHRPGVFDSYHRGHLVTTSKTPFSSSALVLLHQGYDPDAVLSMHRGHSEKPEKFGVLGSIAAAVREAGQTSAIRQQRARSRHRAALHQANATAFC